MIFVNYDQFAANSYVTHNGEQYSLPSNQDAISEFVYQLAKEKKENQVYIAAPYHIVEAITDIIHTEYGMNDLEIKEI